MKDWDRLYFERGMVQRNPSEHTKAAIGLFKRHNLAKILDLGCGTGRHTALLADAGFKVWGCDASRKSLQIVRELIKGVEFRQCDMKSLPYDDGFFDGIVCYQVLQHGRVKDIKKGISEMHRVLRTGGVLFIVVVSTRHSKYPTGEEIEPNTKIYTDGIDGDVPHHFFTEEEMEDFFSDFEIIKLEHVEGPSEINPGRKTAAFVMYAKK